MSSKFKAGSVLTSKSGKVMATYPVDIHVPACVVDNVAIRLRRRGFVAYVESSECGKKFYIVTDATRAAVNLEAGNGLFLG